MGFEIGAPTSPASKAAAEAVADAAKAIVPQDAKDFLLGPAGRIYTNKDSIGDKFVTAGKLSAQVVEDVAEDKPAWPWLGSLSLIGTALADMVKGAFSD